MAPLQRSKSGSQTDQLQIQHFIHQHLLQKMYMASAFNCDGCNTGGFGLRYRCSACDFDVHEQCATSPHRISSHHHPHHHLILVNRPGDSRLCDVCKGATKGLSYICESHPCQFNIHTLCIQIPQLSGGVSLGGYNAGVSISSNQPVLINQMNTMQLGGYNTIHPVMVNNQQKQGVATTALGGYHGVNNINQTQMINQQQWNNNQPQMINPQQQGVPITTGFDCYHNSQPVMVNQYHQQQQQVIPTVAYNTTNHQLMTNHPQQLQGIGIGGVGGYNVVNHNPTVMINHPQQPQQQSNGYTKVGKLAANILSTSIIGVPIFNSRN